MMRKADLRPSGGFLFVVGAVNVCVAFFAFALAQPPLDAVWQTQIELGIGRRPPLSAEEREVLQGALLRYPELASALAEDRHAGIFSRNDRGRVECGYAYLVRQSPDEAPVVTISFAGAETAGTRRVTVRTRVSVATGVATPDAPLVVDLPDDGPFPQLVEIRVTKSRESRAAAVIIEREERR